MLECENVDTFGQGTKGTYQNDVFIIEIVDIGCYEILPKWLIFDICLIFWKAAKFAYSFYIPYFSRIRLKEWSLGHNYVWKIIQT